MVSDRNPVVALPVAAAYVITTQNQLALHNRSRSVQPSRNSPAAEVARGWPFIFPLEGLTHSLVKVLDELQNSLLELLNRGKAAPLEQTTHQNTEPTFNLIEPGSVLGDIDKANPMRRVRQKFSPSRH